MECPLNKKECNDVKCYHVTDVDKEGNVENLDLCKKCFFNDFKKPKESSLIIHPSVRHNICECGLSFEQYIKTGILGCPLCYYTFQDFVSLVINKVQTTPSNKEIAHTGKSPKQKKKAFEVDFKGFLAKIEKKLSSCVEQENYEEAHRLKTIIMGLKSLIAQFEKHSNNSEQQKLIQEEINKLILRESQH